MAKVDIMAVFRAVKASVEQGMEYAKSGYSRTKDTTGQSKMNNILSSQVKTEEEDFSVKQLTLNNVPEDIINTIKTEFAKILDFLEMYLLNDNTAGFYGSFMSEFEVGINFAQKGLIDVDVKTRPVKLNYNPFYCIDFSINELLGATNTELERILYMHPLSFSKLNPERDEKKHSDLEAASSVSATDLVLRDIKLDEGKNRTKLHKDTYTRSDFENELEGKRSVNQCESIDYYYEVAQAFRKKSAPSDGGNGQGQGQGSGNGQNNQNNNSNGQGLSMPGSGGGNPIHDWEGIKDQSEVEDKLKDMVKNAYDGLSDKQKGNLPAGVTQQIELLFKKPEINWKQIFRKFIGLIPSGHRPSRMRLNRRQPDRFDLSGTLSNKVVRVIIGIDTSGSMSDSVLEYCLNEVAGMCKGYKTEYTIIECDCAIGRVYTVTDPKEIKPNLTGRGGTSYIPVIEYINEHKFRDAVMIYFTDGYGDYEIPKPKTYRNLWVLTEGATEISLKNPYGEVKTLKGDEQYQRRFGRR